MAKDNMPLMLAGGVSGLASSLRKIGDEELSKEMKAVTLKAAQAIVPYAKKRVPVDTGALRDSIKASSTRRYARIKAGTPSKVNYARIVHRGHYAGNRTKWVKGEPFIKKAIPEAFPEIVEEFYKGMNRVAKRFEKKHGANRVIGRYTKK